MTCSLQPGDAVRVRGERWRVVHVTAFDACAVAALAGAAASNAGATTHVLLPFEPADRLPRGLERPRVVRAAAWRRAARAVLAGAAPSWGSLRAAARANLSLLPYQLEPVLALVRGLGCRVLLADEVGLGKTIQAGLIAAELLERERDARALIVVPAGLRDQWRDELRERFAIDAAIVGAAALARRAADLPAGVNPWAIPRVAIVSIDFLKRADVIRSLEALAWDLVVFDEAHALSGRSDRAIAADLVAQRARRVVLITATPHSGDERAFERLRGLGRLGPADHLLTFRRSRADAGVPRARSMRRLAITPTREEARMHRALAAYAARVGRDAPADTASAARLAMVVLGRRASSSAASLVRSIERRIALLRDGSEHTGAQLRLPIDEGPLSGDEEPIEELAAPGLRDASAEQRWLDEILNLARAVRVESKVAALRRLLRRAAEPAIVFTEYRDTLQHLAGALDGPAAALHGGLATGERAREARRFTHGDARLLLATDAASEGLNLHYRCRLVVSLDVPWTPLRLEQRVGRVDRLGQGRRVHAITFLARGTAEAVVAAGLDARAREAERAAPFAPSTAADGALQAEARAEAARLASVRALACAGRPAAPNGDRPALAVIRGGRRRALWLAVRLVVLDRTGAPLWTTVKGLSIAASAPAEGDGRAVHAWFERVAFERAPELMTTAMRMHDAELAALRSELTSAMETLIARERGMLDRLDASRARLAAPLLDVGLFDRRAVRARDAQRRVADEAALRARDRVRELERRLDAVAGERCLAFAVAWRA